MKMFAARGGASTLALHAVEVSAYAEWQKKQSKSVKSWLTSTGFEPKAGAISLLPGRDGKLESALVVVGGEDEVFAFGGLANALPPGRYQFATTLSATAAERAALGFGLGAYRFDRYKTKPSGKKPVELVWPKGVDRERVMALLEGTFLVRDLINTPAEDMGPSQLEAAAKKLTKELGGRIQSVVGEKLLTQNYPAIHAVGRASADSPRLLDMHFGSEKHPKVTLVGKGVCFDTGGLDIKPSSGMLTMKKDMGGAAHVLGLALALVKAKLPIRLRVLIPAVENNISGNAYRPLDVLSTRKGLTIEVGNTDAEGRIILADALAEATSEKPEIIIDFATLTGAARVALGSDVPVLFSNDASWAQSFLESGRRHSDHLWELPLYQDYKRLLESKVADINNTSRQPYGGAITAALFLEHFVEPDIAWAHIDVMAWNVEARAGRPVGGEAMGLRAVYHALAERYGKTNP